MITKYLLRLQLEKEIEGLLYNLLLNNIMLIVLKI